MTQNTEEFNNKIYKVNPDFRNTDFILGEDSLEDIIIDSTEISGFWYFKHRNKGLIKRFVLGRTSQVEKVCVITLIKRHDGKFTPRFDFNIWNISNTAIEKVVKRELDENLIKAKVSFDTCHENFSLLIGFIRSVNNIDFGSSSYVVVDKSKKDIFDNLDKISAVSALHKKYGTDLSETDINLLLDRRSKLDYFSNLLKDSTFFENERLSMLNLSGSKIFGPEKVWQKFFEDNQWIFGYGLQLISCEGLDDKKLEQIVVGNDVIDGTGKRIDALMKTRGNISKILFCEIKTHLPNLLIEKYDRPGVYVPAKELRGAVAQIQKTIHKASLKGEEVLRPVNGDGDPTGEQILFVKPRGIVVIGTLTDFIKEEGINYEELSSFEIYRQQINGIDIITYDELYERASFIVSC